MMRRNPMTFVSLVAIAATVLSLSGAAVAQTTDHAAHHAPVASAPMADGEVRKVDKEQGKVTLKHGPITNLEMPGMTMVFRVADPKMLDAIKQGDKVKFAADNVNGALTVTVIEAAK